MDNIIQKNIFDNRDLHKLSPDYRPVNLYLRMQIRRAQVQDSHFHGVNRYNVLQRKPIKKAKDNYSKLTKEIVKLRNHFHNINLKNQVMFKHSQAKKIKYCSREVDLFVNEDIKESYNDPLISFEEFTKVGEDLIIKCDKDFKLKIKEKPPKLKNPDTNEIKCTQSLDNEQLKSEDELKEDIIRINCTYVDKCPSSDTNEDDMEQGANTEELIKKTEETTISDLQSLLTMMTLSSTYKNDEDKYLLRLETVDLKLNELKEPLDTVTNNKINYNKLVKHEGITEILYVKPISVELSKRKKSLVKKYIYKWKQYVRKRQECIHQQRQKVLNAFFENLEKRKCNVNSSSDPVDKTKALARDYSTYQHRYKVQRHIIALQKAKLEEQNRMIEELKYNKILEASRQSVDAMREEVRKSYYEIDRQLKPKIKCLTNELKIPEIDESTLVLQCLKVPQFLQRMERRAREREEKHAIIRERRRQMEEERLRLKQQAELAKAEMDKEEKIKRMKELREKRKKEKLENIRKKQFAERIRALTVMADLHYEKYLLIKYGIKPFKRLLEMKRDNIEKAKAHYTFQLKKNTFLHFMWYTEDMVFERNFKAEDFHRKKILRNTLDCLKQNHQEYVLKKQVAEDYYDLYVTQLVFRKFREAIGIIKKENEIKWQAVVDYYNSNIMFKIFTCWRTLPALNALQREQEARKARWRKKVLQVVPDYTPPED